MKPVVASLLAVLALGSLVVAGCAQPAPTPAAPAAPAKAAEPAKPAAAPTTAAPQPTKPAAPPTQAAAPQPAAAPKEQFPAKDHTITLIIPWATGGSADVAGRIVAAGMERTLGVPIQVVNKAGASSQVGLTELAQAKPDGYTIGMTLYPTVITTYLEPERKAAYTRQSFLPIAYFSYEYYVLFVKGDSPYKTAKDLMDAAKAKPEQVKLAFSGFLGGGHINAALWQKAAGVQFAFVQFDSAGLAVTALLGGHVDAGSLGGTAVVPHFKSGDIRVLGLGDVNESKTFPGVPTMPSLGFKDAVFAGFGMSAPAGTPKERIDVLSAGVKKTLETDEVKKRLDDIGHTIRYLDPAGYAADWGNLEAVLKPLMAALPKQ